MRFDPVRNGFQPASRLMKVWRDLRDSNPLLIAAPSVAMVLALALYGDSGGAEAGSGPHWSDAQLVQLQRWIDQAPNDGLPRPDTTELRAALESGRARRIDPLATALATRLARMHLSGAASVEERIEWHIEDPDGARPLGDELAAALGADRLDAFFAELRPQHTDYAALRTALASEADPARRDRIARNMERWRWLPQTLGADYVMANAAGFEVDLWRDGQMMKSWAAISGRKETPTPSLMATATAINFNPWWEVPESISSVSRMSRRLGYIQWGKRFRQKPGPNNSLGRMKVVMLNPHNIYLHDTPSRYLFGAGERAFSHGCIRVNDALGFAQTLIGHSRTQEQIDKILEEDDKSVVVDLPQALPVYVAYFTVDTGASGRLRFHRDIYGRDAAITSIAVPQGDRLALAAEIEP